jgi:hypothetical protein
MVHVGRTTVQAAAKAMASSTAQLVKPTHMLAGTGPALSSNADALTIMTDTQRTTCHTFPPNRTGRSLPGPTEFCWRNASQNTWLSTLSLLAAPLIHSGQSLDPSPKGPHTSKKVKKKKEQWIN